MNVANNRIVDAPNARIRRLRDELLDFILFMIETMARVGELRSLTVGQVRVISAQDDQPEHLLIDLKGKRGHRQTVAGGVAVDVFKRRAEGLKPHDRLWRTSQRDGFRELLTAAGLRYDSFGVERNLKSLRVTAISFKVLAGAPAPNLTAIARAAGTSIVQLNDFFLPG